jgi:demethoxyubiquinone hydroxylase (CLK1/Coq7/Cat5 family)
MKTPDVVKRICASFFYDCLDLYKKEEDAINWAMDEIKDHEIKELKLFLSELLVDPSASTTLKHIWNKSGSQIGIKKGDFALKIFQGVQKRIS